MSDGSQNSENPSDSPSRYQGEFEGIEALLVRQEEQWNRHQPVAVETLVQSVQGEVSPDQYLSLICNERYLREKAGESPTLDEYQKRFPKLAGVLQIQWEVDRFLGTLDTHPSLDSRSADTPTARQEPHRLAQDFQDDAETIDGRYSNRSLIGSGGMGVVYQAFDNRLQRIVAIKQLTDSKGLSDGLVARFRREAEAIARIDHLNIVRVFDTGESARGPYIVMEYCPGGSLADWLRIGPLVPRQAAEVVLQIAQGVASAHQMSVIHRDLKPGNILLTEPPQPNVTPCLKISDFGLAKRIDLDQQQTQTGEIVGTPAYLAPEQLNAEGQEQSPPIDIYALGVILYECISGRPPIRGATWLETLRLLHTQEAVYLKRLQPNVPTDLATIAHKCLHRDPAQRYPTARAVADELQRFLEGRPIQARPATWLSRSWKWTKRNPQSAAWISLATLGLVVGLLFWANFTRELDKARLEVIDENRIAQAQRELALNNAEQASKNLAIAMEAVDRFCDNVASDPQLASLDLQPLRQRLLKDAADFQTSLVSSRQDTLEASIDLARAHARLARVQLLMGSGQEAAEQLAKSIAIYRSIASKDDSSVDIELANELSKYGAMMQAAGLGEQAIDYLTQGWNLANECRQRMPKNPEAKRCAADSGRALGEYLIGNGQGSSFAERLANAQEILVVVESLGQELTDEFPNEYMLQYQLAQTEVQLARIFLHGLNMRRFREAQPYVERSIELLASIVQNDNDGRIRSDLAKSYGHRSRVLRLLRRRDEEAVELARAIEQARRCMNEFPTNISYRTSFGFLAKEHVAALQPQKRWNEMISIAQEAIEAFLVASAIDPQNLNWKIALAEVHVIIAPAYREIGSPEVAIAKIDYAINLLSNQDASQSDKIMATLSDAYADRSESNYSLGNFAMAISDIDEAIKLRAIDSFVLPHLKVVRARAYAAVGQIEMATAEIRSWKESLKTPGNVNTAFVAAETLAIVCTHIQKLEPPDQAELKSQAESSAALSLELLETAARIGLKDLQQIDGNRSFDVLGNYPKFQEIRGTLQ